MGSISIIDARALFTDDIVAVISDQVKPKSFLRSFFKETESTSKTISIEVQRNLEKIAVDVIRGTDGNRNTWDINTMKKFEPPYFREFFDATELDVYDAFYSGQAVTAAIYTRFVEEAAQRISSIQDKIDRSYELLCSQVLHTGVLELQSATNIDFKRKAASLHVPTAGNFWPNNVDPDIIFKLGLDFLRTKGRAAGSRFNVIMGDLAFSALQNNTVVQGKNLLQTSQMVNLVPAQAQSVGAAYHGYISVGSYILDIWTYPEIYDNASYVATPYIDEKSIIMLPLVPQFTLSYAAVPQLMKNNGMGAVKGKFLIGHKIDEYDAKELFDVKSAGLPIPGLVDQIFTAQVVA